MQLPRFMLAVFSSIFLSHQTSGVAAENRDSITPVLITMGGYFSCGQNPQDLSDWSPLYYETAAGPILGITIRLRERLQKKFENNIGLVISCYNPDPGPIYYTSNLSGQNTLSRSSVDEMLQRIFLDLSRLPNPVLAVVGHSYGGWTAMYFMQQLAKTYPVRYLATIDPISRRNCTPDVLATDAYNQKHDGECQKAPGDFDKSNLDEILGKAQNNWHNYYQSTTKYLHSGPMYDSQNLIMNREIRYPDHPDTLGGHLRFLIDENLVNELAEDLASKF